MEKIELKDAFSEFKNQKNIDRPTMMGVLEDVFRTQIAKTYGSADNFDIIINIDKGDCEIYWNREVVEEVEDPITQIAINDEALDDDYELGETFAKRIELKDFGRRGILNIRQFFLIVCCLLSVVRCHLQTPPRLWRALGNPLVQRAILLGRARGVHLFPAEW